MNDVLYFFKPFFQSNIFELPHYDKRFVPIGVITRKDLLETFAHDDVTTHKSEHINSS